MPMIEGAGVPLSYSERGEGPAVLLIHGIAADAQSLEPIAARLAARVITYDRRGYGDSGAPEPYERTTVAEQSEDAAALLRSLKPEPAVVAGDGFGALIALDMLTRHGQLVRAAVLSNPPLFAFVPEATEMLAAQRERLEQQLRDAGPEAAVAAWLGDRVDAASLARAQAAHRAFFADYAGLASWPVTRAELRAIRAPLVVLTEPRSAPAIVAAAEAIAALAPHARRREDGDIAAAVAELVAG
jgi:pimeloyl-ACP methyl ester carboxylesterase